MRVRRRLFIFGLIALCLNCCITSRIQRNQSINVDILTKQIHRINSNLQTPPPSELLPWKQAINIARSNNKTYLKSADSIKNLQKQQKQQLFSILPRLATFVNISSSITSLSDINRDDVAASLIANLNIPSPFQFYARRYAFKLQELAANLRHENNWRELNVRLYQIQLQQTELEITQEALNRRRDNLNFAKLDELSDNRYSIFTAQKDLNSQKQNIRLQLNKLLNTPGKHWRLTNPPNLTFCDPIKALRIGKNDFGALALKQQAIQLELAKLQLTNVKLNRLPKVSFSASNPPLFSTTNNDFDTENIRLFAGLNKSISIADPMEKEAVLDTQERLVDTKEQLRATAEREILRLHSLQRQHAKLTKQLSELSNNSPTLEELRKQKLNDITRDIQTQYNMKQTASNIAQQIVQIELQLWQWDDSQWQITYQQ